MSEILRPEEIEAARERIRQHIYDTPLEHSSEFSALLGNKIYHKLENLQVTGSFKIRGGLNAIFNLSEEERSAGIVAASAGNHAQGIAYGAQIVGIPAAIVMPIGTPLVKLSNVRKFGAEVIQVGENYDESAAHAKDLAASRGAHLIHAFNNRNVIAGQGTIGLELLEQLPDMDAVLVPVGGGGLISGIGSIIKARAPHVQVIGVQATGSDSMVRSLAAGEVRSMEHPITIADGIRVAAPGPITFEIARRVVDQIVTVDDDEIANAVLMLIERDKSVVEGAGATPLAAMLHGKVGLCGKNVVLVLSGGNIDVNVLSRIIDRGLVKTGRLVRLVLTLPDTPGSLAAVTTHLARLGANVLQVSHDRAFSHARLDETTVEFALETRGGPHAQEVVRGLESEGYAVQIMTN